MGAVALPTLPPNTFPARDLDARQRLYAAASRAAHRWCWRGPDARRRRTARHLVAGGRCSTRQHGRARRPAGSGSTTIACAARRGRHLRGRVGRGRRSRGHVAARRSRGAKPGVALERFAVVRPVPPDRWAHGRRGVARRRDTWWSPTLPPHVAARRRAPLVARARERACGARRVRRVAGRSVVALARARWRVARARRRQRFARRARSRASTSRRRACARNYRTGGMTRG